MLRFNWKFLEKPHGRALSQATPSAKQPLFSIPDYVSAVAFAKFIQRLPRCHRRMPYSLGFSACWITFPRITLDFEWVLVWKHDFMPWMSLAQQFQLIISTIIITANACKTNTPHFMENSELTTTRNHILFRIRSSVPFIAFFFLFFFFFFDCLCYTCVITLLFAFFMVTFNQSLFVEIDVLFSWIH